MRVSLLDELGAILVDATSVDDNEGLVKLDYLRLLPNKNYTIKYEFFDKQLVSNWDTAQENSLSGVQCRLPFIVQELLIQDRRLVKSRIAKYNSSPDKDAMPVSNL